jgi:hypothetical protein
MLNKILVIQDLYIDIPLSDKIKILTKDSVLEPDENGLYEINYLNTLKKYTAEDLLKMKAEDDTPYFMVLSDVDIVVSEISEDEDDIIRNWRIQLDIKTTKRKLKEIQKIVNEKIKPLL